MGALEESIATNKALIHALLELRDAHNKGLPTLAAYSYKTCAELLDGLSEQTIRRLVAKGELKLVEGLGSKPRVQADSFWAFVGSNRMLRALQLIEAERDRAA